MKTDMTSTPAPLEDHLANYPLLDALRGRRSRRFGLGMKIDSGPFAYQSRSAPLPLTEEEEAMLAFAACGITGYALADLAYGPGQGGSMLAGLVGRTVASPDAMNAVSVVVINDQGTYLLKRPQDFDRAELPELIALAQNGELTELYRRLRIQIADRRAAPPVVPGINFNINRWSLYAPGGTYFLPINEVTALYINAALEAFDEEMGLYVLDERASLRPAGIERFGRSKGGHLHDRPDGGRVGTIHSIETALLEGISIEQGMMLQNLGLMAQAIGLGGFANFAAHEFAWFEALGFRMGHMPATRYLGLNPVFSRIAGWLGRDRSIPYALGLERDGKPLLTPYCPPYYPTMEAAVRAYVDRKFGPNGVFRGGATASSWRNPAGAAAAISAPSAAAVQATIAYCEYIFNRYGKFPAYGPPFRTVLGYQATHVDVEFYDRFYRPEALTETQREHLSRWHSD